MTREQAHMLLEWAHAQNPGPWLQHSVNVARAAETIASACGMDASLAYAMGLLHDVGRYEGFSDLHHVISGHKLMMKKGEPAIARVCLTHSFPLPDIGVFSGRQDCTPEEAQWLAQMLSSTEYDDYDRLIQLCDSIALATGITTLEKRLVDVSLRHGFNDWTLRKWQAFMQLKAYFDECCHSSIYCLFREEITAGIFS